jgi:steroid delta-isomerase-like uncharacterized protein
MSDKHEALSRRFIEEVWNKGRLDTLDQFVTHDVQGHDPVNPTKGMAALRDVVQKYRTAFPDLRIEIQDVFSSGDKVVTRWRASGTQRGKLDELPATGRQATVTGITIDRFSGDRIIESYGIWDALGLMQQLGVVTMSGRAAGAGV